MQRLQCLTTQWYFRPNGLNGPNKLQLRYPNLLTSGNVQWREVRC